jgi:hypothetical protein
MDSPSPDELRKSKDAFALHQDMLLWSRVQTLIAIQGGTLAGIYSLNTGASPNAYVSVLLAGLGLIMTVLLLFIAERDQIARNEAFELTGYSPTLVDPVRYLGIRGKGLVRLVFVILMTADIALLLLMLAGPCSLCFTLTLMLIACTVTVYKSQERIIS